MSMNTYKRILRIDEVSRIVGVSNATLYRWIRTNQFPKFIKLSATSTGWLSTDIDNWIESRIEASEV